MFLSLLAQALPACHPVLHSLEAITALAFSVLNAAGHARIFHVFTLITIMESNNQGDQGLGASACMANRFQQVHFTIWEELLLMNAVHTPALAEGNTC